MTTVLNYQGFDMFEALDVIGLPLGCVIGSHIGSDDFFGGALPLFNA